VCDIVVSTDTALFGFTERPLGILPAMISPFVLPKIGVSAARELFLTGMRFDAQRAREIGLVHAVVPEELLDETVQRYVNEMLSAAPTAVAAAKGLIPHVWGRRPEDVADLTARAIAAQRVSPEGQEGLSAFLAKRKPGWVVE
jgi:methylglutaconyl-CoA hydratase